MEDSALYDSIKVGVIHLHNVTGVFRFIFFSSTLKWTILWRGAARFNLANANCAFNLKPNTLKLLKYV